jgi:excisionase family DNA binding protein
MTNAAARHSFQRHLGRGIKTRTRTEAGPPESKGMRIENSPVGEKAAGNCLKLAVSIREAAAMLSISPRSVQNYIRLKTLPARKIGRRTVIPVRALEAFLRTDHESPTFSVETEAQQ